MQSVVFLNPWSVVNLRRAKCGIPQVRSTVAQDGRSPDWTGSSGLNPWSVVNLRHAKFGIPQVMSTVAQDGRSTVWSRSTVSNPLWVVNLRHAKCGMPEAKSTVAPDGGEDSTCKVWYSVSKAQIALPLALCFVWGCADADDQKCRRS